MQKLLSEITARPSTVIAGGVELHESTGQVCTRSCRSAAHADRVRTGAYRNRL
ncbi:hypothetical protein SMC26_18765 [Actinomadura fulvescens]|uniref:Uncharacterized protein n=1 Tax=Actinomadura fulvescens TaxID=46160 RepID=A0ABP6CUC1_9ACTN